MKTKVTVLVSFWLLSSLLVPIAAAQPPIFLLKWGSFGSGDGQFIYSYGVATVSDQYSALLTGATDVGL